ncbi:hypothetical protein C3E97_026510 [Pseudomonas sp. MWU12-2115]|nr:hypothetical protein C3E97_026510 [Pseudomonas sp. MWU12-2115]
MGAGLLAKAVDQSTSMLNVSPLSRASPLPQGEGGAGRGYSVTSGILRGAMKYIQVRAMKYIAGISVNNTV